MGIPANLSVAVGKELTKEAMETLRANIYIYIYVAILTC